MAATQNGPKRLLEANGQVTLPGPTEEALAREPLPKLSRRKASEPKEALKRR